MQAHWSRLDHRVSGQRWIDTVRHLAREYPAEQESGTVFILEGCCTLWCFSVTALPGFPCEGTERSLDQQSFRHSGATLPLLHKWERCRVLRAATPFPWESARKLVVFVCKEKEKQAEQGRRNTHLYKLLVLKKKNIQLVLELKRSKSGFFLPCTPAQFQTDKGWG